MPRALRYIGLSWDLYTKVPLSSYLEVSSSLLLKFDSAVYVFSGFESGLFITITIREKRLVSITCIFSDSLVGIVPDVSAALRDRWVRVKPTNPLKRVYKTTNGKMYPCSYLSSFFFFFRRERGRLRRNGAVKRTMGSTVKRSDESNIEGKMRIERCDCISKI